jgi:hypothetical protein
MPKMCVNQKENQLSTKYTVKCLDRHDINLKCHTMIHVKYVMSKRKLISLRKISTQGWRKNLNFIRT